MKVLITGANGFVGRNLIAHLSERNDIDVVAFNRDNSISQLPALVCRGRFCLPPCRVNRPQSSDEFKVGNTDLTLALCDAIKMSGKPTPVLYTSSTQADRDNPYGISKLAAEHALHDLQASHGSKVHVLRLPNVFGKWARPDYNSAVATFCHNITRANGRRLASGLSCSGVPVYSISVGELADQFHAFRDSRDTLISEAVGTGLVRALYSTYVSLPAVEQFTYDVPKYGDPRGVFVEMLKTRDSGQFSYFTAHPGVTRGGHYHHSKTEKFLVIKGKACFRFRHIVSGEFYELFTEGEQPRIVENGARLDSRHYQCRGGRDDCHALGQRDL
ncbi:NAD dependent epimerase/dehydratase family domain-containing protein [Ditylenchus destructor]|nr:NAD dependent epimerase/dehydratase family domain-containing protein [Ditylenchus destructor]